MLTPTSPCLWCAWARPCLAVLLQLLGDLGLNAEYIWFRYIALRVSVVTPSICCIALVDHKGSAIMSVCMIACIKVALWVFGMMWMGLKVGHRSISKNVASLCLCLLTCVFTCPCIITNVIFPQGECSVLDLDEWLAQQFNSPSIKQFKSSSITTAPAMVEAVVAPPVTTSMQPAKVLLVRGALELATAAPPLASACRLAAQHLHAGTLTPCMAVLLLIIQLAQHTPTRMQLDLHVCLITSSATSSNLSSATA